MYLLPLAQCTVMIHQYENPPGLVSKFPKNEQFSFDSDDGGKSRSANEQRLFKWWTGLKPNLQSFNNLMRLTPVKRILLSTFIAISLLAWLARIRTAYLSPRIYKIGFPALYTVPNLATPSAMPSTTGLLPKPKSTRIIGFMYYGRRRTVEILQCYLRKNLVSHGGFLDEIRFIVNTDNTADLAYLSELVNEVDEYTKISKNEAQERTTNYEEMLSKSVTRDALMIKIDDDLVSGFSCNDHPRALTSDRL